MREIPNLRKEITGPTLGPENTENFKLKATELGNAYPIEMEKELVAHVRNGNMERSRKTLNVFLGKIFLFAQGNLRTVKLRLFELNSFLSRAAMENGNSGSTMETIDKIMLDFSNIINNDMDFEQICFLAQHTIEEFILLIGQDNCAKSLNKYLSKAVDYMTANYTDELTLRTVADAVYISSFYLSHLFRNEMDTTFSDYLCKIRIEKAKRFFMDANNFRIQEVAEKTGFDDPNYFTKSFKKIVGMTPREYKKIFR